MLGYHGEMGGPLVWGMWSACESAAGLEWLMCAAAQQQLGSAGWSEL